MDRNDYSSNRQHEIAAQPGSELIGQQRQLESAIPHQPPLPAFQQAVIREVFYDPTLLDKDRIAEIEFSSNLNPSQKNYLERMPRHSIIATLVSDGVSSNQAEIFFPFFPSHMILPIKAGERVWVFKDHSKANIEYGYWVCRVTEPRDIDDLNLTHADRKLDSATKKGEPPTFANGALIKGKDGPVLQSSTATVHGKEDEFEQIIQESDSGKLVDFEAVPRFTARPGDHVIQGSNNTLISLGTDRSAEAAETETNPDAKNRKGKRVKGKPEKDVKKSSGPIDVVVGRGQENSKSKAKTVQNSLRNDEVEKREDNEKEGDPDFENDLARIYVSMKTAADDNFAIKTKGLPAPLKKGAEASAIVAKADHLRLIARKEIRILVQPKFDSPEDECAAIVIKESGDIIFVPATKGIVKLGGDDADKAIVCTNAGAVNGGGTVTAPPLITTMGGVFAMGGAHGMIATKILVK
jgi:hypothetical protein